MTCIHRPLAWPIVQQHTLDYVLNHSNHPLCGCKLSGVPQAPKYSLGLLSPLRLKSHIPATQQQCPVEPSQSQMPQTCVLASSISASGSSTMSRWARRRMSTTSFFRVSVSLSNSACKKVEIVKDGRNVVIYCDAPCRAASRDAFLSGSLHWPNGT